MKYKATQKSIKNGYSRVISIGYCDLQDLLSCEYPIAYTCGVYGWNANVYHFGNTAIVTGYRPFGDTHPDYNIIHSYNELAKAIKKDTALTYSQVGENLANLIKCFINEVTK